MSAAAMVHRLADRIATLEAEKKALRAALLRLTDAAYDVGFAFLDVDIRVVKELNSAMLDARAALKAAP